MSTQPLIGSHSSDDFDAGETANLVPKKEDRFKPQRYNDLWATVLFVVTLLGFTALSVFSIRSFSFDDALPIKGSGDGKLALNAAHVGGILATSVAVSSLFSFGYFVLLQRYAGKVIKASLWAMIGSQFVFAAAFLAFYILSPRRPIGLIIASGVCLLSGALLAAYPATFAVGAVGLLAQSIFGSWWLLTAGGFARLVQTAHNAENDLPSGVVALVSIFTVIKNAVHITIAGVFGAYYFLGAANERGVVVVSAHNPTMASAKRALTTSLGPNCYGSLLISLVSLIRTLISVARSQAQEEDNIACSVILCCIECIVSVIEQLLEYFNRYAFAQVAIYGKDYCSAGKDTYQLLKSRGIDAVINDDLIGNVLNIGSLVIALLTACAGLAYVVLSTLPKTNGYYIGVGVGSFLIGLTEFSLLSVIIDSGVTTTFVCLAEDPLALARTKPALYSQIQSVYPTVMFF